MSAELPVCAVRVREQANLTTVPELHAFIGTNHPATGWLCGYTRLHIVSLGKMCGWVFFEGLFWPEPHIF